MKSIIQIDVALPTCISDLLPGTSDDLIQLTCHINSVFCRKVLDLVQPLPHQLNSWEEVEDFCVTHPENLFYYGSQDIVNYYVGGYAQSQEVMFVAIADLDGTKSYTTRMVYDDDLCGDVEKLYEAKVVPVYLDSPFIRLEETPVADVDIANELIGKWLEHQRDQEEEGK